MPETDAAIPNAPSLGDELPQTQASAPSDVDTVPSFLDHLRAEFAKPVEKKSLFKRLPARDESLVAEYKPLSLDDAKKAMEKESDPMMLISSLRGIWAVDPGNPAANDLGLVPLGAACGKPDLDPLGFDRRLTDLIGIEFGTASEILLTLFEGNDLAIGVQAAELGEWSAKTKRADLQDFKPGS